MCHTSRKQNGVHLAIKHNSSTAYLLGNAVNHGIKHQSGMGVSLSDAPLYGGNVGSTQMGGKSRLAGNTFLQFFGSVTPRVTKVYQLPGGQGACTFGRKRTETVEGIGHVHRTAVAVDSYGNASTQVTDNQIEVFVMHGSFGLQGTTLGSIAPGDGSLVQGVPDGDAGHQRRTGDACHIVQLVHHAGIGYERGAAGQHGGKFVGYQTT